MVTGLRVPLATATLLMEVLAEVWVGPNTPRPIGTLNWLPDNAPVLCVVVPLFWLTDTLTPLLLLLFLVVLLVVF